MSHLSFSYFTEDQFSKAVFDFQKKIGAQPPTRIAYGLDEKVHESGVSFELLKAENSLVSISNGLKLAYKITRDQRALRAELILEEAAELCAALLRRDEIALADSLGDLLYAVIGACITYSIPVERIFNEIHRSNMTKTASAADHAGDKGKGVEYSPPNLEAVLYQFHRSCEA